MFPLYLFKHGFRVGKHNLNTVHSSEKKLHAKGCQGLREVVDSAAATGGNNRLQAANAFCYLML